MNRILITGANSYVGTSVEHYLTRWMDRYEVDTLSLRDLAWKDKSFSRYDAVFHVAGVAHSDSGRISKEKARLYYAVNTDLTIETAKKAKADGVGQFIFMSSAIVYGDSAPIGKTKIITKDTPAAPSNCYGDSKMQAKGLALLSDDTFHVAIIRPPMIYGKGCKGNYLALSKIAQMTPVFPYVDNQRSMLYIENLCEFVRILIEERKQGTFWPQNREYSNTSELVKMIAQLHGKKVHLLHGMTLPLKILSRFVPAINKAFGSLSYDRTISEEMEDNRWFSLEESLGRTEG